MRNASAIARLAVIAGILLVAGVLGIPVYGCGSDGSREAAAAPAVPRAKIDRFDGPAAYASVKRQVALGPRPAGSAPSRRLAASLRRSIPKGRFEPVPGGLRNVVGRVRGRTPRRQVIVAAHYDTKEIPGFLGANDGASGTAIVRQLARTIKPRRLEPTVLFMFFDGEESPAGTPDDQFELKGLRGSKVAAPRYRGVQALILLDFVGERALRVPSEDSSDPRLWAKLRRAATRVGVGRVFPAASQPPIIDDHTPFLRQGVPAIDLIDFDFPCWHQICDDLSRISERSLDAVGETMVELLRRL